MNEGSFTRKICVTFFNKPEDVARLKEGSTYNVSVNIESREYNGRWYTDIRAWRLQPKQEAAAAPMPDMPPIAEEPSYASAPAGAAQGREAQQKAVVFSSWTKVPTRRTQPKPDSPAERSDK